MKLPIFLISLFLLTACSNTKPVHPTLQATLWVQNSTEFDALAIMTYQTAETKLREALMDKTWTAELSQIDSDFENLPPAVILDIDETVLDNSPFQARMIENNSGYDPVEWEKWVLEGNADAISGAINFTTLAAEAGVTVIYLSNREANTEQATRLNLESLGFPLSNDSDVVLLKGEQENWTSSKIERRLHVASQFRVIMLFGDDFNDFLPAKNMTITDRDILLEIHRANFGEKWFILPNPIYGSWNDAIFNFDRNLNEDEKQKLIETHLQTKN
ncbi:MAG: HAD family acid phosphatase [Balneolaceae bacterium]